ncbi:hypothetical protein DLAC_11371 [Tieghemostelium lacteum]|uniref:Methyltransferase n=1 Tax=Tieghemostelium lacteum TaxID=361077 RepID=A0A151Z3Y5_TIELA|nr:hypothetical protein DLAC_11371 [Tieghemostelium lacteum]|eukprot:KYQ88627.1 hypothetical protein DLAC_11371 [Tieghemostelium lacteum]
MISSYYFKFTRDYSKKPLHYDKLQGNINYNCSYLKLVDYTDSDSDISYSSDIDLDSDSDVLNQSNSRNQQNFEKNTSTENIKEENQLIKNLKNINSNNNNNNKIIPQSITTCTDTENMNKSFFIRIKQQQDGDEYGLYVWRCSQLLSCYIYSEYQKNEKKWEDKIILEVSSGVSLPSLLLSKLGAQTIITDVCGKNQIQKNIENSIRLNVDIPEKYKPTLLQLTWGSFVGADFQEILKYQPLNYLIISDCFYNNTKDYDSIFSTLYFFLMNNNNLEILITYQSRSLEKSLLVYFKKWNLIPTLIQFNNIVNPWVENSSNDENLISTDDNLIIFKLTLK